MGFADADMDELRVGLPLRLVYRIKNFDNLRGNRRYFWKATPMRTALDADTAAQGSVGMATGIRDKVAILGMGCSRFGER